MRKKIVAGNWKMNTTVPEGVKLAKDIKNSIEGKSLGCDVILGVPFTHLVSVVEAVKGSPIIVAAENCADQEKGAYTGEVSPSMIVSTGATAVILGHSERRQYYGECPKTLEKKVRLALDHNLKVIFCIGENLEEREAGKHFAVVDGQIEHSLFSLSAEELTNVVLAYEPVWAIGTGKTATAEQAQEIHHHIRETLAKKYGEKVAQEVPILYGGSCNAENAPELFAKEDVDGGLIGGASLSSDKFIPIIEAR